jgi:hypothetical protein
MITKSQKRHLKKVEKRKAKKEQRKIKQLREQEESGKLIEENHNGGYYSSEFTLKALERFLKDLGEWQGDCLIRYIQCMRLKYQTLLLKWSPDLQRNDGFYFIMSILDYYRDNKENSEDGLRNIINGFYNRGA